MPPNVPRGTSAEPKPQPASKRLGRGLAQLLGTPAEPPAAAPAVSVTLPSASHTHALATPTQAAPAVVVPVAQTPDPSAIPAMMVKTDRLAPGRYQPRRTFDEAALSGLVESIQHAGVMQPIIVRPVGGGGSGGGGGEAQRYEIVAGERRWRAATKAGLAEVPVVIKPLTDQESAEWAVTENLQREDLNPVEKAWSLRGLVEGFSLTQEQVAQRLGIDRSSVANLIRLTDLEPSIAELISGGQLSAGHGKALLAVAAGEHRTKLAKQAATGKWSVRQTEAAAQRIGKVPHSHPAPSASTEPDVHATVLADLERQLGQYLGTRVSIKAVKKKDRGTVEIEFYGLDHFDGLLRRMGFDRT